MIEFAAPALGGLAAIAVPVLLHIAHRRRFRRVDWGAMRFLRELAASQRRRMSLENLLLLTLRVGLVAALALALSRPQLSLRTPSLGDVIARSARTAAVLVVDDSRSTSAPQAAPAIDSVRALAQAYLATLRPGDEVSVVALSRLGDPPEDPGFDLDAARERIARLAPTAAASDVPALLEAGLARLPRHLNPEAELVLVTDGLAHGFADAPGRWERIRQRLRGPEGAPLGSRARPHLIVLHPPAAAAEPSNLSVDAVTIDRNLLPPGAAVTIRATIALGGSARFDGAIARLLVDSRPVAERALTVDPGSTRELAFEHRFGEPGSHLVEVAVAGARDVQPADDGRAVAVEVESRLPVLLVEGDPGDGLAGSAGLLAAALDPAGDGRSLFTPRRVGVSGISTESLAGARVAVLADVPALDANAVAALERFVDGGGGVLVVAGARTDATAATRFWWRGGDGFLPAALGEQRDAGGSAPTAVPGHAALAAFDTAGGEAWRPVAVRRHVALAELGPDAAVLLALADGQPLLVERGRGRGRVALLATGLDGEWTDLPFRPAFVPLARSLAAWLGGSVLPPRNLLAGERLAWFPAIGGGAPLDAAASGPGGVPLALSPSAWEGQAALLSAPLLTPGAYRLQPAGAARPTWFTVAVSPDESRLAPLDAATLDAALADLPRHQVDEPARVRQLFSSAGDRTYDLWQPLVVLALALLVLENLVARSLGVRERRLAASA